MDLFCVEVLQPSQPNGVMSSAVSLPNHTFTGQALSSKWLTSVVHILSPETHDVEPCIFFWGGYSPPNINSYAPMKISVLFLANFPMCTFDQAET